MTNKRCFAVSGLCYDDSHIFMLDIDKTVTLSDVKELCTKILNNCVMSDIYIIKSTTGYNLFSLDKLFFNDIKQIGRRYEIVDKQFLDFGYRRGYYDLRIGRDKDYISLVSGVNYSPKSNAHRIFFNWIFHLNINKDKYFDNETAVGIVEYESDKHGYFTELVING